MAPRTYSYKFVSFKQQADNLHKFNIIFTIRNKFKKKLGVPTHMLTELKYFILRLSSAE